MGSIVNCTFNFKYVLYGIVSLTFGIEISSRRQKILYTGREIFYFYYLLSLYYDDIIWDDMNDVIGY